MLKRKEAPRDARPARVMTRRLVVFAVLALAVQDAFADGHDRACMQIADYALTSAALAKQVSAGKIVRETATEILRDMYGPPEGAEGQQATAKLLARVRAEADKSSAEPARFAVELYQRCAMFGGLPDLFLGI